MAEAARTHIMNTASLRASASTVLDEIQNRFPRNRALDAMGNITDADLEGAAEAPAFLTMLADKLTEVPHDKGTVVEAAPEPEPDVVADVEESKSSFFGGAA